jgi:hypothetical protein
MAHKLATPEAIRAETCSFAGTLDEDNWVRLTDEPFEERQKWIDEHKKEKNYVAPSFIAIFALMIGAKEACLYTANLMEEPYGTKMIANWIGFEGTAHENLTVRGAFVNGNHMIPVFPTEDRRLWHSMKRPFKPTPSAFGEELSYKGRTPADHKAALTRLVGVAQADYDTLTEEIRRHVEQQAHIARDLHQSTDQAMHDARERGEALGHQITALKEELTTLDMQEKDRAAREAQRDNTESNRRSKKRRDDTADTKNKHQSKKPRNTQPEISDFLREDAKETTSDEEEMDEEEPRPMSPKREWIPQNGSWPNDKEMENILRHFNTHKERGIPQDQRMAMLNFNGHKPEHLWYSNLYPRLNNTTRPRALASAIEGHGWYAGAIGIIPKGLNYALYTLGYGVLPQGTGKKLSMINNKYARQAFKDHELWRGDKTHMVPGKRKFTPHLGVG